ncbi:unnamed protein product [Calypogeia fissa]
MADGEGEVETTKLEAIMGLLQPLGIAIMVVAMVSIIVKLILPSKTSKLNLPPGPKGLPIVGTLFETRGPKTHKILIDLAKKYGPIYTLKTGLRYFIVVTSAEVAYEALVKESQNLSSRPKLQSRLNYTGFRSVNSALYGPYWRGTRKNLVSHVLATKQVASFAPFREEELDTLILRVKYEASNNDDVVTLLPHCRFTIFSILLHVCFGMKFTVLATEELDEILKSIIILLAPQVIDFLPFVLPFSKHRAECQALLQRVRKMFGPIIEQRRKQMEKGEAIAGDYLDSLLALQKESDLQLVETDILGLLGEVLTAGTDTTANTLEWTMANLIQHPEMQARVYDEIQSVAGDTPVSEAHIDRMPYLQAVVKEALRKHPPLPFAIVHGVSKECKLMGYDLPEDALFLYHVQAIQNDPKHWENPDQFNPERFLKPNVNHDLTGSHGIESFHLMPFGAGRRICPAINLGLKHAHLLLARLIQNFEWSHPNPGEDVDFEEHLAFTIVMSNPLKARIRERTAEFA